MSPVLNGQCNKQFSGMTNQYLENVGKSLVVLEGAVYLRKVCLSGRSKAVYLRKRGIIITFQKNSHFNNIFKPLQISVAMFMFYV